jgi:hypothetical protein
MHRKLLWRSLLSVVTLGAFVILAIGSSDSSSSRPPAPSHDKISAYTMCQQFTEDRLKSPSTADWPWGASDATTDLGDGRYRVRTHVDAQNSFGAMIRSQVDCTVRFVGGDKWQLEDLQIN